MRCSAAKFTCVVLAGFAVLGIGGLKANADTILMQSVSQDNGSYEGAYWKLADSGFALTGDPLAQTMDLQSVIFKRAAKTTTAGDLYLEVFTGNTGGAGTFVGASANTINVASVAALSPLTWNFSGITLDKDTTYSFVASLNNTGSNPTAVFGYRQTLGTEAGGPGDVLTSGSPISGDVGVDSAYDPYLKVGVGPITPSPEPSATVLVITGLIGLLAYAWRKRK
jgi:hypothetical protein